MSAFASAFSTDFDFSFVDVARERLSMLKVAGGSIPNRVFVPTGTVDAQARAVLLGLYGGNALGDPPTSVVTELNIASDPALTLKRKMAFLITDTERNSP